jgi:hypothetical protein
VVGLVDAAQDLGEGRLSAAVRAEQRMDLAIRDGTATLSRTRTPAKDLVTPSTAMAISAVALSKALAGSPADMKLSLQVWASSAVAVNSAFS